MIFARILRKTPHACVRACEKLRINRLEATASLRYCDVLVLSSNAFKFIEARNTTSNKSPRRQPRREIRPFACRARLSLSLSTFLACRLYYPTLMLPGALSLSSRLRLPRERNRILSFNSTILRSRPSAPLSSSPLISLSIPCPSASRKIKTRRGSSPATLAGVSPPSHLRFFLLP